MARTRDRASKEPVEATDAAQRARPDPTKVEDPNRIGGGNIDARDGRAAPSEEDLSSKTDFEGVPDPASRAGGDGEAFDPHDLDLTPVHDGRFAGDSDLGGDPFGLDVDGDALTAESHGGVPDLPGSESPLDDPLSGDPGDVPEEYSLAGNETGDATAWADLAVTVGGVALHGNPVVASFAGAYGITRGADEALGMSDAVWDQVDGSAPGRFGDGEPASDEPEDGSGVDPGSSQLGDDKPADHRDAADPNGQSEGEPDTEPQQSTEPDPDNDPDGQSGGEPEPDPNGQSVGEPATEPDQSTEPDPGTTTQDLGEDSQNFGRSPSMDDEIGETYFEIQQGALGGSEVQYADQPSSGGSEPLDYDGVDYGGEELQPVEDIPADVVTAALYNGGDIDPHEDPTASFTGVDDSADAATAAADDGGDAAEVMEG